MTDDRSIWHVYLVQCGDGSLYCGIALDMDKRLAQHNNGTGAKYTTSRRPVKLVWYELITGLGKALQREHQIKRMTRKQKLALIERKRTYP